jgi:hypothetical protein
MLNNGNMVKTPAKFGRGISITQLVGKQVPRGNHFWLQSDPSRNRTGCLIGDRRSTYQQSRSWLAYSPNDINWLSRNIERAIDEVEQEENNHFKRDITALSNEKCE